MKKTLCLLLLSASSGAMFAQVENPTNGDPYIKKTSAGHAVAPSEAEVAPPPQVGILVEYIQLDDLVTNKLLRKYAASLSAIPLREDLEKMLDEGAAELVDSCYLKTVAGQRAKVESIDEMVHPTGYDPPDIAQNVTLTEADFPGAPANPKGFEMRPVGTTMEVDPVVSADGRTIHLNIAPELTRFLGREYMVDNREDLTADNPLVLSSTIYQPKFYTMKSTTAVSVPDGDTVLLSIHRPNDAEDKMILVLLRADILK